MSLKITDGNCVQIKRGERLINQLGLSQTFNHKYVSEFCFSEGGKSKLKVMVALVYPESKNEFGEIVSDEPGSWDLNFLVDYPTGYEDFFNDKNGNAEFYASFEE